MTGCADHQGQAGGQPVGQPPWPATTSSSGRAQSARAPGCRPRSRPGTGARATAARRAGRRPQMTPGAMRARRLGSGPMASGNSAPVSTKNSTTSRHPSAGAGRGADRARLTAANTAHQTSSGSAGGAKAVMSSARRHSRARDSWVATTTRPPPALWVGDKIFEARRPCDSVQADARLVQQPESRRGAANRRASARRRRWPAESRRPGRRPARSRPKALQGGRHPLGRVAPRRLAQKESFSARAQHRLDGVQMAEVVQPGPMPPASSKGAAAPGQRRSRRPA